MNITRIDILVKQQGQISISLANINNLLLVLEKEKPSNDIEVPDVAKVDLSETIATLEKASNELLEVDDLLKKVIKSELKTASEELREKYRMYLV